MTSLQSNLLAINANRQLNININKAAKATEKLSSGYRINRAGDDATSLAISEKMRRQIRQWNKRQLPTPAAALWPGTVIKLMPPKMA